MSAPVAIVVTPAGHGVEVWADRIAASPRRTLEEVSAELGWSLRSRLLVLGAHPDDETLGCGRLMHTWSRRGQVTALTATAGEACVDHVASRPDGLGARRLLEWRRALQALGARARSCPRLPDGGLARHVGELVVELDRWLDEESAADVVLAAPWRHDPHPDHAACGRVAALVAARRRIPLVEYPIWMTYWTDVTSAPARGLQLIRLRTDAESDRACRLARGEFVSQLSPLSPELAPVLPSEMLRHHEQQLLIVPEPS